ncbi:glycoside hydrolase family 19 protein [Polymorphobacter multimanifer]|uniref:glycoside hydrolase family 19 protein n=1 Tax=Polymorphobacter multimanifer TaxID=1070431 RepID=UPI001665D4B1|nr:glycoside hydrolase family 19 protein [Polymorphobacter multimanifer]
MQRRLGVAADGLPGPVTFAALFRAMGADRLAVPLGAAAFAALQPAGILSTQTRLGHWLGQNAHESLGFTRLVESLNYTSAARIREVWPSRFPTVADAMPFVRQPELLAEHVYGGRMGNSWRGAGWRFRGRGLKMITGANNYAWLQQITGVPLMQQPDLAAEPATALRLSAAYWAHVGCHGWADADDVRRLSNLINRGDARAPQSPIGLADRVARTRRAAALIGGQ